MFKTIVDRVDLYRSPSFVSEIVGQLANNQEVQVAGDVQVIEGWIWHKIKDEDLWIIERSTDGNRDLRFVEWTGSGIPPRPAGVSFDFDQPSTDHLPDPPDKLTVGQVLEALLNTTNKLKVIDQFDPLLKQSGLDQFATADSNTPYTGTPIKKLNLDEEIKLTLILELRSMAGDFLNIPRGTTRTTRGIDPKIIDEEPKSEKPKGRFQVNDINFTLDGKPFRFVGVNVREIAYYGYHTWPAGQHAAEHFIDLQLDVAKEMKAQVFRLYAPYHKNPKGQFSDTKEAIRRIKKVLDKAAKRNMFALITLDDAKQSGFNVGVTDHNRYREPANRYNMDYYRSGYKETFIPFVRELVGALGGHDALFAWGVCNEAQISPYVAGQAVTKNDVQTFLDYFRNSSEVIRQNDDTTLITTSIEACHNIFVEHAYAGRQAASDKLYRDIETIDFATVHTYRDIPKEPENFLGHNHERGLEEMRRAKKIWHKPVVVEEMGPVGGPNRGGAGEWVTNALRGWFDQGAAGCMQWGFSAADSDIGVGDNDSGMHRLRQHNPNLPYADWDAMFNAYRFWGNQFWIGK